MKIITGYTGTQHINAEDDALFFQGVVSKSNYVLNVGDKLSAQLMSNNVVRIGSGDIIYGGRHARILDYEDVQIQNGTQGVNRTDVIVARYSIDEISGVESIALIVIKGGTNVPAAPKSTDMLLYTVTLQGVNIISCKSNFKLLLSMSELDALIASNKASVNDALSKKATEINNLKTDLAAAKTSINANKTGLASANASIKSNKSTLDSVIRDIGLLGTQIQELGKSLYAETGSLEKLVLTNRNDILILKDLISKK